MPVLAAHTVRAANAGGAPAVSPSQISGAERRGRQAGVLRDGPNGVRDGKGLGYDLVIC